MLNENLAQKFGQKINLSKFTLEQLQDARNRIRTTLSQVETNESFNAVQSENYQKSKMYLDVLNLAIKERENIAEAKPDYIDLDKDGDKKEPMKKAAKDAKKKKVKEGKAEKAVCKECGDEFGKPTTDCKNDCNDPTQDCWVKESEYKKMDESLNEGKEDEAELTMAAKDMVDRVTGWMEDTAEMQTESMLELADAIRDELGSEASETFVNTVKPALESLYSTMETTREALTQGVGQITGEADPMDAMGAEDDMGMEPTTDMDDADIDLDPVGDDDETVGGDMADDDFGADEAAAGGEEEAGRAKRESVERSKKK